MNQLHAAAGRVSEIEADLGEEAQQVFLLGGNVARCLLAGPRGDGTNADGLGRVRLRTTVRV